MLTMNTSSQQSFLVWRYLQPRQLMATDTSGRQNKVSIPQVIERRCWTMGIASLKEGSSRAVWRVDICTRRLNKVKSSPSTNDEMTYLILVLVEDKRRCLPVELNSMLSGVDTLVRRSWHDNEDMRE